MTSNRDKRTASTEALETLGLFLILVTCWASEQPYRNARTSIGVGLGWLALRLVSVVGWTVDRLPTTSPIQAGRPVEAERLS